MQNNSIKFGNKSYPKNFQKHSIQLILSQSYTYNSFTKTQFQVSLCKNIHKIFEIFVSTLPLRKPDPG